MTTTLLERLKLALLRRLPPANGRAECAPVRRKRLTPPKPQAT